MLINAIFSLSCSVTSVKYLSLVFSFDHNYSLLGIIIVVNIAMNHNDIQFKAMPVPFNN